MKYLNPKYLSIEYSLTLILPEFHLGAFRIEYRHPSFFTIDRDLKNWYNEFEYKETNSIVVYAPLKCHNFNRIYAKLQIKSLHKMRAACTLKVFTFSPISINAVQFY